MYRLFFTRICQEKLLKYQYLFLFPISKQEKYKRKCLIKLFLTEIKVIHSNLSENEKHQ